MKFTYSELGFLGVFLAFALVITFLIPVAFAINPSGANVTKGVSSTAPNDSAGSDNAIAGNVTQLNIYARTTTQSWQGYYGNVTGTVQLADGSNNVFYNWSQASPRGEIYSSTNSTIYWSNVQCFNFTAAGNYASEVGLGGTTNTNGTNLTQLHSRFGLSTNASNWDVDAVNVTFSLTGAGTHNAFFTASQSFSEGECRSTRIFDSTGAGVNDRFEEVLQYEPVSASVIFTAILNQDLLGFNSASHDFEMLVLEDGHGTDTATTPYYFFVELQ